MLNKTSASVLKIFAIALFLIAFSAPSFALEKLIKGASPEVNPYGQPRSQITGQRPVMEDAMLVVTDVMVDQTAENAVIAREQAMAEARRLAFRMLAERHLSPSAYANLKMPDDMTIATLVQDFEIRSEQLSSTRYVANFTVRFRDAVRNFISIPVMPRRAYDDNAAMPSSGQAGMHAQDMANAQGMTNPQAATGHMAPAALDSGAVLLLPYYENMAGKTILWEDPNPWREMWQLSPPRQANAKHQVVVPLGDIGDISAGPADAVWSGDYTAVEKLRRQYGVAQVVLAVANKSGAYMTIDIHVYDGKALRRRNALTPYVGEKPEEAAWQQAMYEVISYLQRPQPDRAGATVENISRSVTRPQLNVPEINTASVTTYPPPERAPAASGYHLGAARSAGGMYAETYRPPQAPAPYDGPRPSFVVKDAPYAPNGQQAAAGGEDAYQTSMSRFGIATQVEAAFAFSNFSDWMDVQKRLSSANPPVRMDIRAISRNSARFVLRYNGNVDMLRQTLAGQGIGMTPVQTAGGAPVYTLHLVQ